MATMKEGKEKGYGLGRSHGAVVKRAEQLKNWQESETNQEPEAVNSSRRKPRVKFSDGVVFLAATAAGDMGEVEQMVTEEGIDVNYKNQDGMTALHQCCIDDNLDMAMILVKNGANIDSQDKEGWTPLHAASSCGHAHIVEYLLDKGAFPAPVNSDGDTPYDIAEDEHVHEMLQAAMEAQGIDAEKLKLLEENLLLSDAISIKTNSNSPTSKMKLSAGGASGLHIACAKNYSKVLEVLLSASNIDIEAVDDDGWTPLHAAVYWGNMEAAEQLVEHGANVDATTKNGEKIEDLIDPEVAEKLDDLRLLSESHRKPQDKQFGGNQIRHSFSNPIILDAPKHSPSLKRRHSKDRAEFPKTLDMMRERKDLQNLQEIQSHEEQTHDASYQHNIHCQHSSDLALNKQTASIPIDSTPVTATSVQDTQPAQPSSLENSQEEQRKVSDGHGQEDGTIVRGKRLSSVSERRKMFENFEAKPSPGQERKTVAQRKDRIPVFHSSSASSVLDKDKTLQSTPVSQAGNDGNPPKRFSFVAKSVPDDAKSLFVDGEPKLVGKERTSSGDRIKLSPVVPRHDAFSTANRDSFLQQQQQHDKWNANPIEASYIPDSQNTEQQQQAVMDTLAPNNDTSHIRSGSEPCQIKASHSGAVAEDELSNTSAAVFSKSGSFSTSSSVSQTPDGSQFSERSFSRLHSEEAEAKRRLIAKKKRETRRATQPVDLKDLKLLAHEDERAEQLEKKQQADAEMLESRLKDYVVVSSDEATNTTTIETTPTAVVMEINRPVQSRFKPAERPAPRVIRGSLPVPEEKLEKATEAMMTNNDSDPGAMVATASSSDSSTVGTAAGRKLPPTPQQQQQQQQQHLVVNDPMRLVPPGPPPIPPDEDRVSQLQRLLEEECSRKDKIYDDYYHLAVKLEELKKEKAELTRRSEDTSRAYEQEKSEREHLEAQLKELKELNQCFQDISSENQRLKDENGALIRVIGKLSRTPLQQQQHH